MLSFEQVCKTSTVLPQAKAAAQLASQAKTGSLEDHISLDVHSIDELKNKGVKPTDDHFKYNYKANSDGDYTFQSCLGKVIALRRNKQFVQQVS